MKRLHLLLCCMALAVVFFACERNNTYVEEVAGPVTCVQCHDPSDVITGKRTQWEESGHGMGESYVRGTSAGCAGCHSGSAFAERIAAGLDPDEVESGDPSPTRQDCRTCHMIHVTYTYDDFALKTTSPVTFYAMDGVTYSGGEGNLCVNCHQPRRVFPVAENDTIYNISSHWGPHHGPQSAMLLGVAGAGVQDMVSGHYGAVENTCVHCHLVGAKQNHLFEPEIDALTCVRCHPGAESLRDSVQAEVADLVFQLGEQLVAAGLINENSEDGHPIVDRAQQDQAVALWNWIYVAHEDKSMGVHNSHYAFALLEEGLARMNQAPGTPVAAKEQKGPRIGGPK